MEAAPGDGDHQNKELPFGSRLSTSMTWTDTRTAAIRWRTVDRWMGGGVSWGQKRRAMGVGTQGAVEWEEEEVSTPAIHMLCTRYIPYIQIIPTTTSTSVLILTIPIIPVLTTLTLTLILLLTTRTCRSHPLPPLLLPSTPTLKQSPLSGLHQWRRQLPAVTAARTASRLPHPAVNPPWEGRAAATWSTSRIEGLPLNSTTTTAFVMTATALTTKAATAFTKTCEAFKRTPFTPTTPTGSCRECLGVQAPPLPLLYPAQSWLTLPRLLLGWPIKNSMFSVSYPSITTIIKTSKPF